VRGVFPSGQLGVAAKSASVHSIAHYVWKYKEVATNCVFWCGIEAKGYNSGTITAEKGV